uniref:ATP synthase subunit 8 n=1 Tax=Stenchaetothrips biformis TaxID=1100830 RepID=UPI0030DFDF71
MPQILPMSIPIVLTSLIITTLGLLMLNETKWMNKKKYFKNTNKKNEKMFFLSLFIS